MTELVALHSVLRRGREEGYDATHERIPEDLIEAHRRAGIQDWRIWRSGHDLFHLVECDDFGAAMHSLESEPANPRWQAVMRADSNAAVRSRSGARRAEGRGNRLIKHEAGGPGDGPAHVPTGVGYDERLLSSFPAPAERRRLPLAGRAGARAPRGPPVASA